MQADLVDTQSFLDADKDLTHHPMADRFLYILDKPVSWSDLIGIEAVLFGYAVVWDRGKLRVKDVIYPPVSGIVETLDDSTRAAPNEKQSTDTSVDTVVNSYELKIDLDANLDKFDRTIVVNDADSKAAFGPKQQSVQVPIYRGADGIVDNGAQFTKESIRYLVGRPFRFPSQVVKVSLGPKMINRIYAADLVTFTSDHVYSPLGTGVSKGISQTAIVIGARWNYKTRTGSATLMLLNQFRAYGAPWTPAALITAKSGATITLAAHEFGDSTRDPEDGTAFDDTDKCLIIPRSPSNPGSVTPQQVVLQDDYGDAGARKFTLDVAMTADPSTAEYVLVFDDYSAATTSQKTRGTWQANENSELLSGSDKAARYG
jgi:hypothetical protein